MSQRLRLADLLGGLSIVSDLGYGLPVDTALRSCLIGTALARQMALPEREVADVFYVSLLFHVGCVGYAHETSVQFGDDLAVRRAAVETNLTDVRDIFARFIPHSTRGLPPAARVKGAVRMAMTGRAFGKAHDQASCEVARSVSRRIGLPLRRTERRSIGAGTSGPRPQNVPFHSSLARARTRRDCHRTPSCRPGAEVLTAYSDRSFRYHPLVSTPANALHRRSTNGPCPVSVVASSTTR